MVMADPNATVCERLTRRHGVRIVCAASVEDCCLAVGNVVGHENIVSPSRMNSAIVVFLNDVEKLDISLGPALRGRVIPVFLSDRGRTRPNRPGSFPLRPGPAGRRGPRSCRCTGPEGSEPQAQPAAQSPLELRQPRKSHARPNRPRQSHVGSTRPEEAVVY
ncbi:hypothetical protein QTP70_019743 [Hemibagrus guttatus]|uniref:Uncharacterized protein n=1 Tax=Hemibagrus guttatus TaxID=175788 RepID=A0AAE0UH40_9TELE|nr:hypothetical protein QTP70_019743 [Hemibagrus guttatus]